MKSNQSRINLAELVVAPPATTTNDDEGYRGDDSDQPTSMSLASRRSQISFFVLITGVHATIQGFGNTEKLKLVTDRFN